MTTWRRPTIRVRLTIVYGLLFLVAGVALIAISYTLVARTLPARHTSTVTGADIVSRATKMLYAIDHGQIINLTASDRDAVAEIAKMTPAAAARVDPSAIPVRVAKPLFADLPHDVRSAALHELLVQSGIALGIVAAVCFAAAWVVAGRVLRPLQTITDTARRLSASDLHARLALDGPDDELHRLADTFDAMLARLDAAFTAQQRFVANASHELRTPLTIMRTELDVTLRRPDISADDLRAMATTLSRTVERCEQLINALLTLAASEHGVVQRDVVDLAAVVRTVVERHDARARARHIAVRQSLEPAPVDGDAELLERLVENLVDNGIRHNHDGGIVEIALDAGAGSVRLVVANTGAVIPPDRTPQLFEPFRRLTRDRTVGGNGAGLGLSIVRSIAAAHDGRAESVARDEGGLSVTITLPRAPAALVTPASGSPVPAS
jgi:signal transduction histidine kinase